MSIVTHDLYTYYGWVSMFNDAYLPVSHSVLRDYSFWVWSKYDDYVGIDRLRMHAKLLYMYSKSATVPVLPYRNTWRY
jgi:hypothetical protein